MTRTQFPIGPGFAVTVNRSQGLTFEEGVVINLAGSKRFRPAAKHGLPFVGFTRSQSFAMTTFKNLPPWNDFAQGAESSMLRTRQAFLTKLQALHRRTMAKHSTMDSAEAELAAQADWDEGQARSPKRRKHDDSRRKCPCCDVQWETGHA